MSYLVMVTMTRFIASVSSGNTDDDIGVASGCPEAAFLNAIGIDSSQLLTEDVVGRSDFMGMLRQCMRQWIHINRPKRQEAVSTNTEQQAAPKPSHKCTYTGCGHIFSIQYQLQCHKQETGHKCGVGRKKNRTC